MRVELSNERICISAVNEASHFDAFAAGSGTAEAVHTDFEEEFRGLTVRVENIADDGVFCDFHFQIPNLSIEILIETICFFVGEKIFRNDIILS